MSRSNRIARVIILCIAGLCLSGGDAYAYLDPGTGSYFIQILIATLLGVSFAVKTYWSSIKTKLASFLSKKKK